MDNSSILHLPVAPTTPYYIEFLDAHKRRIIEILIDYIFIFSVSVLGIVTNCLVIIVYAKQGFQESVAVSMTTISIWDLMKSISGVCSSLSGILSLFDPIAAFSWNNITTVVFDYFICFSTYVTSVMAAFVAVERCLCVTIPLKVKWLLTPRVTLIASLAISVIVFGTFAVLFGIYDIIWTWDESYNATVAIYEKNDFYLRHEEPLFAYFNLCGTLWPIVAFIIILIATVIIVVKLRESSKFRSGNQNKDGASVNSKDRASGNNKNDRQTTQEQNFLKRDRQVVKMLLVIIIIYIVALAPRITTYIVKCVFYEFHFLRRGHYIFQFAVYICFCLDLLNGSVNFFIFYKMSSSFRTTFQTMVQSVKSLTSTSKDVSQNGKK